MTQNEQQKTLSNSSSNGLHIIHSDIYSDINVYLVWSYCWWHINLHKFICSCLSVSSKVLTARSKFVQWCGHCTGHADRALCCFCLSFQLHDPKSYFLPMMVDLSLPLRSLDFPSSLPLTHLDVWLPSCLHRRWAFCGSPNVQAFSVTYYYETQ